MTIITIGIDLAKNIFAVHRLNESGHTELVKPKVSRNQLLPLIANFPPCLIGWRACSGEHHRVAPGLIKPPRVQRIFAATRAMRDFALFFTRYSGCAGRGAVLVFGL